MEQVTLYLNCDDNGITFNKKNFLLRAAERLGFTNIQPYNTNTWPDVDYVLNIEPFRFVKGKKWTGIWEIDLLCDRQQLQPSNWVLADRIYLAISTIPERMKTVADNADVLFQACDPELHKRIPSIKQEYDFVLTGLSGLPMYSERDRVRKILMQNFSYFDFGNGRKPDDYVRCLNTAKVQFIRSMNQPVANGEIAQRFFECMAIGPVLTNYVPDLELTGFTEDVDYLAYRNDEEMLEKMQLLVENEDYRNQIAYNARRKSLLHHTYEHRLVSILQDIYDFNHHTS